MILLIVRESPLRTPYLLIASIEYSEQVGVNLQLIGNRGDMQYL
jgi:hypothetical protein